MEGIEMNPRICNGKPVVAGTRIPVTVILDQLAEGDSIHAIVRRYPEMTVKQVAAALRYCHRMPGG